MKRIVVLAALGAFPATAQELEFDLGFDDEILIDETVDEPAADLTFDEPAAGGLDLSATNSVSYATLGSDSVFHWDMRLDASSASQLGDIGYLEWALRLNLPDAQDGLSPAFDIRRLSLQNSVDNLSWKLGKFRLGWGEIEGTPVLDVLNPALSLDEVGVNEDELPGQWMGQADYFAGNTTLTGFVIADPQISHVSSTTVQGGDLEMGLQAQFPFEGGKFQLYAAQLLPQAGVLDLGTDESSAQPYTLVGASVNKAIGPALLEFDIAGKFGLERSDLAGLSSHDRLDVGVGIEYAVGNSTQITAAVYGQYWLEQTQDYFVNGPDGPLESPQFSGAYLLSLSDQFADGAVDVSANVGGALDGTMIGYSVSASYTPSDLWKLSAGVSGVFAETGSAFEMLDGTTTATLGVTYYYGGE